jgi:glycosyltransferase involved in cell wall biosynthesis
MKITFALGHELPFPPDKGGGVNSLLEGLCKALATLGHDVTAYSPSTPGRPDLEIRDGVRHVRVRGTSRRPRNFLNVLAGVPYALRLAWALEPCDVFSGHLWHGFFFSLFKRARVVTHTIHRDPKRYLLLFALLDRIYSGSDTVTEAATRVVPLLADKCRTIYNAVDFTGYAIPSSKPRDGKVRFLFIGRFSADKGLDTFIPAFCDAAKHQSDIFFKSVGPITAGEGADESLVTRMRMLVDQRKLSNRVDFMPPIYDRVALDTLIHESDVVVLPSVGGETLNMSILESMRIGRALLISDLPANSPLLKEGLTGLFACAGDQSNWSDRILEISRDHDRLERFGVAAYHYGREHFSCEHIAQEYVQDFEALLAKTTT